MAFRSAFRAFRLAVNRVQRLITLAPKHIFFISRDYNTKIMMQLEKHVVSLDLAKQLKALWTEEPISLIYLVENRL
jgi:hypothetical protein